MKLSRVSVPQKYYYISRTASGSRISTLPQNTWKGVFDMAAPAAQTVDDVKQQVVLETPRLILRAAQSSDAVLLYEAFSDPEVMRYW